MIQPRGRIFKIETDEHGVLHCYWLHRNEALFAEAEWEWLESEQTGYLFDTYDLAVAAATKLKENGEEHVHACVVAGKRTPEEEQRRFLTDREVKLEQYQEALERMNLT